MRIIIYEEYEEFPDFDVELIDKEEPDDDDIE